MRDTLDKKHIVLYIRDLDLLKREIGHIEARLHQLKTESIDKLKAQIITDMPLSHSGESPTESQALKRIEQIKDVRQELNRLQDIRYSIETVIDGLDLKQSAMVWNKFRYVPQGRKMLSWDEVAAIAGQSSKACCKQFESIVDNIKQLHWEIQGKKVWDKIQKVAG